MIVALDLDGTLLTCMPRHCAVARYALAVSTPGHAVAFNATRFWNQKRNGHTTRECLFSYGEHTANVAAEIWRDQIENISWLAMDSVLDGTLSVLQRVLRNRTRLVLISARRDVRAAYCQVIRLGLHDYFSRVHFVPQQDTANEKATALREAGARIYIGDTELDFAAATTAGIECRLVDTGVRSATYLTNHTNVPVFHSLAEALPDGLNG